MVVGPLGDVEVFRLDDDGTEGGDVGGVDFYDDFGLGRRRRSGLSRLLLGGGGGGGVG